MPPLAMDNELTRDGLQQLHNSDLFFMVLQEQEVFLDAWEVTTSLFILGLQSLQILVQFYREILHSNVAAQGLRESLLQIHNLFIEGIPINCVKALIATGESILAK